MRVLHGVSSVRGVSEGVSGALAAAVETGHTRAAGEVCNCTIGGRNPNLGTVCVQLGQLIAWERVLGVGSYVALLTGTLPRGAPPHLRRLLLIPTLRHFHSVFVRLGRQAPGVQSKHAGLHVPPPPRGSAAVWHSRPGARWWAFRVVNSARYQACAVLVGSDTPHGWCFRGGTAAAATCKARSSRVCVHDRHPSSAILPTVNLVAAPTEPICLPATNTLLLPGPPRLHAPAAWSDQSPAPPVCASAGCGPWRVHE